MIYNPGKIKYEILIVDDIPENIQILASILSKHHVNVSFAVNGIQTLQSIKFKPPDLVLLDVSMPTMDGFETCKNLQENTKTKEIPVIFLTARSQKEDIVKGFEVGAVDYITKPFNSKELLSRVFSRLHLKRSQDIISSQNKLLSKKNEQITKSIYYAKRIQEALLPSRDKLKALLPNHFLLYLPKDIVSGDFYWISEQDNKIITAVIDSTGHGVPGAFMSIIGHSLMNEIVNDKKITEPKRILSELNTGVIRALHSESEDISYQHDGMDATICTIDKKEGIIKISSANQLLYYFENNEIKTIEGDIYCIGGLLSIGTKIEFEQYEFDINAINSLYLFSDGYQDQFGGSKNKKYMVSKFKELIQQNYTKNLTDQEEIFKKEFDNWKGTNDQLDDVLVMGIKF